MKTVVAALVLSSSLISGMAHAFPTGSSRSIRVEGNSVGRVEARNRVVDQGSTCRYTLQWTLSSPALPRTVRCDIVEYKASNAFDCNENARRWVTSIVQQTGTCQGFDEFGQQTRVSTLTGGESSGGVSGVFYADSVGDLQSVQIN